MHRIYLDYAASTPCDPRVWEAMRPFFFEQGANALSPHAQGRQARKTIEDAREVLAAFIAAQPSQIVFTSGATESNNHAIFTTAKAFQTKGKHIIASAIEHHSVMEPLCHLQADGFEISFIKPKPDGIVAVEDIKAAIRKDTILVCLIHANNEFGSLQQVQETGSLCRQKDIKFLVDATQAVGHVPVNTEELTCDFLSLSAHKFYGPKGVGALYVRQSPSPAFILGGDQERGRRAGTPNTPGIVGLGEAIKLCRDSMPQEARQQTALRERVIDVVLNQIPNSIFNGHREIRLPNNAHFSFEGVKGEELVSALDMAGISVSMGSACTWGRLEPSHMLKAIGLSDALALASLRVVVGRWTTEEDITYFLEQLKLKVSALRKAKVTCKNVSSNS